MRYICVYDIVTISYKESNQNVGNSVRYSQGRIPSCRKSGHKAANSQLSPTSRPWQVAVRVKSQTGAGAD